jgi:hypothetical protein
MFSLPQAGEPYQAAICQDVINKYRPENHAKGNEEKSMADEAAKFFQDRKGIRLKVGSPVYVVGTVVKIEGSPEWVTITVDEDDGSPPQQITVKAKQVVAQG